MKFRALFPLALAVVAITPAAANWFSNPALGINRNVGSAPSPTPEQVRAEKQPPFVLREQAPAASVAEAAAVNRQPVRQAQAPAPQPQQVPVR